MFERLKELIFGEEDHEIVRQKEGETTCAICNEKIKGGKIFKVPASDKSYCKTHAKEEADKVREDSFSAIPEELKNQVHYSRDESYHLTCSICQKPIRILEYKWTHCTHCKKPMCKEESEHHTCVEKEQAEKEKLEADAPRRCFYCGKKTTSAVKCEKCFNYFCEGHAVHHGCKY